MPDAGNLIIRPLRRGDETRTMDQLRADVVLDLLKGTREPTRAGRGTVDVNVDLATLAGLSDASGDLRGYGPVIAEIARRVAEADSTARWRAVVTDPSSGAVVHSGVVRRRPTAQQQREVEMRDRTCVFPGCRMPAVDCDVDHRIPVSERGPTDPAHLAPACRHDHRVRHRHGWRYRHLPDGRYRWTSPLGHTYHSTRSPP